jgi:pimeloyl-ACP methyl ester carboxylesterase
MTQHPGGHAARLDAVGPLHVQHAGAGPAVVLIHAGVADSRMWDPQWAAWQTRFALTRLDLRGFGRSGPPLGSFSHARDVLAVLDAAGIARARLVGASFGGLVALDVAAAHPERVAALVLAGPPLPGHPWSEEMRGFFAAEERALEDGDLDAATEVNVEFWAGAAEEPVRAAVREQQLNAFRLQVEAEADDELLTEDLPAALAMLGVPALVVTGEQDKADFQAIADRLAATLPDVRRAIVASAGHLPSLEQPAAFDELVLPFLEGRG